MMPVRANKPKPIYRATEIATSYQHLEYYTPPYHPELQPIELIWANIKGGIADDSASNMAELRVKFDEVFESLDSDTWTNAYQHAQEYEQKYLQLVDECELVSDSEDSEHDSFEDSDVSD
ncbi:hypothetical protein PC129_g15951 [Phytophthora cactorum]|uniref:Tc1-like transposase DDE domain-containing protein n=2 Tax=Phytophthora cactorum TaxID=29920 RepID=A0A8T1HMB6_9STRA|nr:hypothetical protein Pcac1_g20927 [Phytophthora cactorum]KAG2792833.1 hypothetical protein PC111_g23294 [Phytophthora cactorum]KAG2793108.1 hypothetical protein PC112_g23584 [Phytophthora cactorum]KAG2813648.1 hypothetical protein PC113_g23412 [Phytophthora cactorum]KAG2877192.1 hypothetical protein PC115_g23420 [Phytophthora cactorum]